MSTVESIESSKSEQPSEIRLTDPAAIRRVVIHRIQHGHRSNAQALASIVYSFTGHNQLEDKPE